MLSSSSAQSFDSRPLSSYLLLSCPVPLTVVIPAKDEAQTISAVINGARRYATQIIVVDGHSVDETARLARQSGADVIFDRGRGKGDALRGAVDYILHDLVVFMDADGSHDAEDIPKLVEPILAGEADHVTGSRLMGGSSELHGGFDECFRLMGSSFITACINWRFQSKLSDSQNGFRAIRVEVLKKLKLSANTTTIEQEMIMKTLKQGYRLSEVPAHEYKRQYGVSKIRLTRAAPAYVWNLIKNMF